MIKAALFSLAVLLAPSLAAAQETAERTPYYKTLIGTLHPGDETAMEGTEERIRAALENVRANSDDPESLAAVAEMEALLDHERIPFSANNELVGSWRVRSLQVDGLGAYAYAYFPARIYPEAQALVFDKDSGSQRHRGLMAQADPETVFFAGALYYGYESARMYSNHTDADNTDRDMDAIAEIYKLGEAHYLMVFATEGGYGRLYEIRR